MPWVWTLHVIMNSCWNVFFFFLLVLNGCTVKKGLCLVFFLETILILERPALGRLGQPFSELKVNLQFLFWFSSELSQGICPFVTTVTVLIKLMWYYWKKGEETTKFGLEHKKNKPLDQPGLAHLPFSKKVKRIWPDVLYSWIFT